MRWSVGTALNSPYSGRFGHKVNPDCITVGLSQHIEQDVILDFDPDCWFGKTAPKNAPNDQYFPPVIIRNLFLRLIRLGVPVNVRTRFPNK